MGHTKDGASPGGGAFGRLVRRLFFSVKPTGGIALATALAILAAAAVLAALPPGCAPHESTP